jgi:hypothetical protein
MSGVSWFEEGLTRWVGMIAAVTPLYALFIGAGGIIIGLPLLIAMRVADLGAHLHHVVMTGMLGGLIASFLFFAWWAVPESMGLLVGLAVLIGGCSGCLWFFLIERHRWHNARAITSTDGTSSKNV